jgi:hypothetical protein
VSGEARLQLRCRGRKTLDLVGAENAVLHQQGLVRSQPLAQGTELHREAHRHRHELREIGRRQRLLRARGCRLDGAYCSLGHDRTSVP